LYSGKQYEKEARDALERAFVSKYPHDDCFELYRASYMAHVPMTQEEERNNVANYHTRLDDLIIRAERGSLICDNIGSMGQPFSIAYYDLDFRGELEKWTRLYMLIFRSQLGLEQSVPSLIDLKKMNRWWNEESWNLSPTMNHLFELALFLRSSNQRLVYGVVSVKLSTIFNRIQFLMSV